MKKRQAVLTTTYVFGQSLLGLWLHPFQTVRQLVEDRVWWFLVFWPAVILASLFFLWRGIIWPLAEYWASGVIVWTSLSPMMIKWILVGLDFLKWWVFYICLIWETLVLTLAIKFELFFRSQKKKTN